MEGKNKKAILLFFVVVLLLLLPIILYVYKFGYILSSSHQRWSEFGAFMTGIYSPIIAFLALLILIGQAKTLVRRAAAQKDMDKHHYDQTHIKQCRKELDFYIQKLEHYLDRNYDGIITIGMYLQQNFSKVTDMALQGKGKVEVANDFNKQHPQVLSIWLSIYPTLNGLNVIKEHTYTQNFIGAKSQMVTCLQYGTCIALDNLSYVVTNDLNKGKYYFKDIE